MPTTKTTGRRVAIACQGGGSHTAFSAGALKRLVVADDYDVVALTGTSGGAIDALLAWYALLADGPEMVGDRLEAFWREMSATSPVDLLTNEWTLWTSRALSTVLTPEISPYLYPPVAAWQFKRVLKNHVDFDRIPDLVAKYGPATPLLLIGAADVLSGKFKVFRNGWDADTNAPVLEVSADAILASAAIPTLFRAVHIDDGVYWDGLFSQNPPVRDLPDAKPDEIWVLQINPTERRAEPTSMGDIRDRRNELSGNLSLHQELFFIDKINQLIDGDGKGNNLTGSKYQRIEVRTIEMDMKVELDSESKLDRSPGFINALLERGQAQAEEFLRSLPAHAP